LEALQGKIGALLGEKKIKEAIQVAEAAVKANEQDAASTRSSASLYVADNQYDKASASFRRSLELNPRYVGARLGLARLALARNVTRKR